MPKRPTTVDRQIRPPVDRPRRIRRNRLRRDWNGPIRRACAVIACVEILVFLLAYPGFRVRNVRIEGLRTLTASQAFAAIRLPRGANIFMAAFHDPLARNLERLPIVDHATRSIELPDTIVLRVAERRPYAVLSTGAGYWLIDRKRVPYARVEGPVEGLPTIQATGLAAAQPVVAGTEIRADWLAQAYKLLTLLSNKESLRPKLITVDQNLNLCLNRVDNLRINIGTPDDLQTKLWNAEAIARLIKSDSVGKADYIDVTCPTHTVLMPHQGKETMGHM